MKPLISKCSMMPAWHQLVPISGHVEESETARKLQLYATSIKTSVSTRLTWKSFHFSLFIYFLIFIYLLIHISFFFLCFLFISLHLISLTLNFVVQHELFFFFFLIFSELSSMLCLKNNHSRFLNFKFWLNQSNHLDMYIVSFLYVIILSTSVANISLCKLNYNQP